MAKKSSPTTVTTGVVRASFVKLLQPDENGKYGVKILIDKDDDDTLDAIEDGIQAAIKAGVQSKWKGKRPKKLQLPLLDGDKDSEREEDEGHFYLNPKSNDRPGIVGIDLLPITDREEIYSGMFIHACITFAPYYHKESGKNGVGVYLIHVMKVKDGPRFGATRESAENAFSDIDVSRYKANKKARRSREDDDEEEETPRSRNRNSRRDDDEEDDVKPRKKKATTYDEDEEEETPRRSKKRRTDDDEEDDDDEYYKPKKKKKSRYDDDDDY